MLMVARTTSQLLLGLAELHARGVTHCDLKPHNVLLFIQHEAVPLAGALLEPGAPVGALWESETIVRLSDMGLARPLHESGSALLTRAGTRAFMAPEVVRGERRGMSVSGGPTKCEQMRLLACQRLHSSIAALARARMSCGTTRPTLPSRTSGPSAS